MAMSLVIWLLWMVRDETDARAVSVWDRVWTRRLFYTDDVGHPLEHVERSSPSFLGVKVSRSGTRLRSACLA